MERTKVLYALLFLSFLLISSLMGGGRIGGGTTVFNFEWIFFFASIFLFGAAGYTLKLLLEGKLQRGTGRPSRGNVLAGAITLLAIFVALKLLFEKKPEKLVRGGGVGETIPGIRYNVTPNDFVVTLRDLPWIFYVLPLVLFFAILLTVKKRKTAGVFEVKFEPGMSYESIEGTPEERVIKMYKNVTAGLVMKGYPYRKSWTHREYEERLRGIFPDIKDLDVLTEVFERARYAGRLGEDEVIRARKSYDRLMKMLR
ncbi:hypothetical protein A3L12_07880 [Thermococcus sp. P6]|uniref:DUF4129 domain-containing protein n=1 Tax=Thermococcus sp. P6 TaxID=122420 RepID=UPI000B599A83|nr:DUF4129 domain-containing protein [Thermococcus sp. P6]ASJ11214.1 hypothetical protein A3L12_07880 [Thermococcus sp. P6]